MAITPKQERFCREYIIDLNATQAAIRAGYSARTAQEQSARLLSKAIISEFIRKLQEKKNHSLNITAERVTRELARIAFSDVGSLFEEDGSLKPLSAIPPSARRAIASLEVEESLHRGKVRKVKLWNKTEALQALVKHLRIAELTEENLIASMLASGDWRASWNLLKHHPDFREKYRTLDTDDNITEAEVIEHLREALDAYDDAHDHKPGDCATVGGGVPTGSVPGES